MRFKLAISVPAMLAIALFTLGIVSILFSYLTISNGRFVIRVEVPIMLMYVITLIALIVFTFVLLKRRH